MGDNGATVSFKDPVSFLQLFANIVLPKPGVIISKAYEQVKSGLIPVKEGELPGAAHGVVGELPYVRADTERGSVEASIGS